ACSVHFGRRSRTCVRPARTDAARWAPSCGHEACCGGVRVAAVKGETCALYFGGWNAVPLPLLYKLDSIVARHGRGGRAESASSGSPGVTGRTEWRREKRQDTRARTGRESAAGQCPRSALRRLSGRLSSDERPSGRADDGAPLLQS